MSWAHVIVVLVTVGWITVMLHLTAQIVKDMDEAKEEEIQEAERRKIQERLLHELQFLYSLYKPRKPLVGSKTTNSELDLPMNYNKSRIC